MIVTAQVYIKSRSQKSGSILRKIQLQSFKKVFFKSLRDVCLLSSFFLLFCHIGIQGCVWSITTYRGCSDMESALKRCLSQKDRNKSQPQGSAGIQERYLQDVDGKLKPHLYTGRSYCGRTWACSAQQDTCQSQKAVGMCPPGFGEILIIWTWHDSASWLPGLDMKLLVKR